MWRAGSAAGVKPSRREEAEEEGGGAAEKWEGEEAVWWCVACDARREEVGARWPAVAMRWPEVGRAMGGEGSGSAQL